MTNDNVTMCAHLRQTLLCSLTLKEKIKSMKGIRHHRFGDVLDEFMYRYKFAVKSGDVYHIDETVITVTICYVITFYSRRVYYATISIIIDIKILDDRYCFSVRFRQ